ncbi:hypothetical protein [Thermotalea metallivorans]|uniref:hypothetical protein n=1 Tax=Thermotalea metallivorans TaxID=520762 RepID=UPI0012ECE6B6|nr:hypothetical protein [Thermotalea metallivorans]
MDDRTKSRQEYLKKYQQENRDKLNEYQRKYRSEHPEKVKEWQERYWMKKLQLCSMGV